MPDALPGKEWLFLVFYLSGWLMVGKVRLFWGKKLRFAMRICLIAWHGFALCCAGIRSCCVDWHQRYLKGLDPGDNRCGKFTGDGNGTLAWCSDLVFGLRIAGGMEILYICTVGGSRSDYTSNDLFHRSTGASRVA